MMRILVIACIAFLLVQNRSLAQSVTPYCPNTVVPTADTLNVEFPIPVAQHGKWGYVDRAGGFVITPQFDCAGEFSEHLAAVKIGNKWGYIDSKGDLVIPAKYAWGAEFSEGLALVLISEGWRPFGNNDVSGIELGALATYIDHHGPTNPVSLPH